MLFYFYKNIMKLSTPLLESYLDKRLKRGKEDALRYKERRGIASIKRADKKLIWFHAASVGESLSLLSLINRIVNNYSNIEVLVTTGTVTSAKLMLKRLPNRAFHQYIPVDHPKWTSKFLDYWKPDMVIWSESEYWPNILMGIKERNIPAILLNARMSEESFRKWQWAKSLIGKILSCFSLCLVQNNAEKERLKNLGAKNIKISGNLKYAAEPLPYNKEDLEKLIKAIGNRPSILWAVTHKGEDEIACRIHKELIKETPNLLTIILPRHPERKNEIATIIDNAKLNGCYRSDGELPKDENAIYIADTMGETGLFYSLSRLCIIGGSFIPWGGHNIIEPAQFGCQIFYGSHMHNFISICNEFENAKAVMKLDNIEELTDNLVVALKDSEYFSSMAENAKTLAHKKANVLDDILQEIEPFIKNITKG